MRLVIHSTYSGQNSVCGMTDSRSSTNGFDAVHNNPLNTAIYNYNFVTLIGNCDGTTLIY